MRLAIISDTHLPRGARRVPEACLQRLRAADLIVHAGDLVTAEVLACLQSLGPPLAAVHGNVDSDEVRQLLPERREVHAGEARIGLIHDAGPARGRVERMRRAFPGAQAVIFGHSHIPLQEQAPDGFHIFNPGSPTDRRRQPRHTMGLAQVDRGRIAFRLIYLD